MTQQLTNVPPEFQRWAKAQKELARFERIYVRIPPGKRRRYERLLAKERRAAAELDQYNRRR